MKDRKTIELVLIFLLSLDYQYSLSGLPEGSEERLKAKHEVHLRSASKLQELCFQNGGIYIKLGQHIGQLVCLIIPYVLASQMFLTSLNCA